MPLNYATLIPDAQASLAEAVKVQDAALSAHLTARQNYEEASNRVTSLTSLVTTLTELSALEQKVMAHTTKVTAVV